MSHKLAKNTFYLTLASVGQKIIAFVYFLFLARVMMPENTGSYFLATSLTMIFSVMTDIGITAVLIREIAKQPEESKQFAQKALMLKYPFTIIAVVGMILASHLLGYDYYLRSLILIASSILILDSFQVFFYGMLRGRQELKYESVGMFVGMFVTALVGSFVLLTSPSLVWLIVALAIGSFVNLCISSYGVAKTFGTDVFSPIWDGVFLKKLMRLAIPFALAAIFIKVYSYIDSIMISKFLGTTEVGLYSIAYKFTYAFQFLPLAFVAGLYPSFSATISSDPVALKKLFERSLWYMMIIAVPITFGIWLVAPEAVLMAGSSYASAGSVLRTLVLVLIPIFLDFPVGALLNSADRQITKTKIIGITMILNAGLNYLLIPTLGVSGAAYAALFSFIFMFVAGMTRVPSIIKGFSFRELGWNLGKILFSGFVMLLIGFIIKDAFGWILAVPVCAISYVLLLFITKSVHTDELVLMKTLMGRSIK